MYNLPTDLLETCRRSTNLAIHSWLVIIIDNWWAWLECRFLNALAIIFIFDKPTKLLVKGFSWLEML